MQLGMVGLGRMGGNIVRRLVERGHECVVFDQNPAAIASLAGKGVPGSTSLSDLVGQLERPRAVWVMLSADLTPSRSKGIEDRVEPIDRVLIAADHQAIAALKTPNAAARPIVDVMNALGLEQPCPPDVVLVIGIAPIDDGVARLAELPDGIFGDLADRSRPTAADAIRASSAAISTVAQAGPGV